MFRCAARVAAAGVLCLVMSVPAFASRVDVTDRSGFGSEVTSGTFNWTGFFDLTVGSEVLKSASGVYTYVYQLADSTSADPVDAFDLAGSWLFGNSSLLDWGTVTNDSSLPGAVSLQNLSFGTTLSAKLTDSNAPGAAGLNEGETFTLYAQSLVAPGLFPGSAQDDVFTAGTAFAPVPEPGSILLFGTGLFGLAGAARRKFGRLSA
jgi:PEP-CTERM motif